MAAGILPLIIPLHFPCRAVSWLAPARLLIAISTIPTTLIFPTTQLIRPRLFQVLLYLADMLTKPCKALKALFSHPVIPQIILVFTFMRANPLYWISMTQLMLTLIYTCWTAQEKSCLILLFP